VTGGLQARTARCRNRHPNLPNPDRGPPLQLTPVTYDTGRIPEWFEVLPGALGVEGLVAKGAASRYIGGRREWLNVFSVGWRVFGSLRCLVLCLVSVVCDVVLLCATGVVDGRSARWRSSPRDWLVRSSSSSRGRSRQHLAGGRCRVARGTSRSGTAVVTELVKWTGWLVMNWRPSVRGRGWRYVGDLGTAAQFLSVYLVPGVGVNRSSTRRTRGRSVS
jgi:hypothetical protein